MSQQQHNPPTVLQQKGTNSEADVKPFSIRQYVLDCRRKSVFNSWPFPNKYLQICLNHGLKDVLPPFESLKGCSSNLVNYSRNGHDTKQLAKFYKKSVQHVIEQKKQNIKNECYLLSHGEGNQLPSCNVSVNFSESIHVHKRLPSLVSSKVMKDKRKRRKGRGKKRSMADILAVARHCTLEKI